MDWKEKTVKFLDNMFIEIDGIPLYVIVGGIGVGVMLAVIISVFYRKCTGSFIGAMVRAGATSPETAVEVNYIGFFGKFVVKRMLNSRGSLYKALVISNEEELQWAEPGKLKKLWYEKFLKQDVPKAIPFDRAKFYLPEENRITAELRWKDEKHPVRVVILSAVVIVAAGLFALFIVPELLTMLKNFTESLQPDQYKV